MQEVTLFAYLCYTCIYMTREAQKSLEERSYEELEALLKELQEEETILLKLKADNPELANRPNDNNLPAEKYNIWQRIQMLTGVQSRIEGVKNAMRKYTR